MGRLGAFARKSAAPPTPPADDAGVSVSDDETVTCPNCQCEFNPETDEVVNAEGPQGADVPIPTPEGDAQAPMGTEAMAALMASLGAQ